MKKIIFFLFITATLTAQKSIHNYKYVIVPRQFKSFKGEDKYQINSLVKFLLKKNNFNTYFGDETFPADLAKNRCLALTADLADDSGMFTTRTTLKLTDCYNRVIFTSKVGKSKIKDYKRAFHEATRKSFESVKALNYKYIPSENEEMNVSSSEQAPQNTKFIKKRAAEKPMTTKTKVASAETLYAQPTKLGFQLVDNKPEVVHKILKTQYPDLFILEGVNGMFIKKQPGIWEAQYYENGMLLIKTYSVKF
ncbi:hypothetical protein [Tenacibaculum sp. M341]|uniref:hypothetical protein n=1 Tax=Tenacibaculum sp. M341 TaxID=2530339 RepID=UPI00104D736A|nr:hypothetical protein [Tenacibaculum sp. M341]TCI92536.1 hypothetical protein EYW44_06455 [Tenacibaculum sp. M341]